MTNLLKHFLHFEMVSLAIQAIAIEKPSLHAVYDSICCLRGTGPGCSRRWISFEKSRGESDPRERPQVSHGNRATTVRPSRNQENAIRSRREERARALRRRQARLRLQQEEGAQAQSHSSDQAEKRGQSRDESRRRRQRASRTSLQSAHKEGSCVSSRCCSSRNK